MKSKEEKGPVVEDAFVPSLNRVVPNKVLVQAVINSVDFSACYILHNGVENNLL